MRRAVAWAVTAAWMLALLSGCAGTPQSRESGATVLAGVLGVEDLGEGFCIRAAAEGRGSQGPFHCESWGQTPAAAAHFPCGAGVISGAGAGGQRCDADLSPAAGGPAAQ